MRWSIAVKLGVGSGLLLSLFVIAAVLSFWKDRSVTEQVRVIVDVQQPKTIAANEMKLASLGSGMAIMKYLQTGAPEFRKMAALEQVEYYRHAQQFRQATEHSHELSLLDQSQDYFEIYHALGGLLMDQLDEQAALLEEMGGNLLILDRMLQIEQDTVDGLLEHDDHGLFDDGLINEKMLRLAKLEAALATENAAVIGYALSPQKDHQESVRKFVADKADMVDAAVEQFARLDLSNREFEFIEQTALLINSTKELKTRIVDLSDHSDEALAKFLEVRDRLDAVITDGILAGGLDNLTESEAELAKIESRSNEAMIYLLLAGLATGIVAAVLVTKAITGPVAQLVTATRKAAGGDLSARVDVTSHDELGLLGNAFNEMMSKRQSAEEALVLSEQRQRQLADENAVNATLGRIISSSLNINDVYDAFATEVRALVPFDRVSVLILSDDGETVTTKFVSGVDVVNRRAGVRVHTSESIYSDLIGGGGRIIASLSEELFGTDRYQNARSLTYAGFESIMGVPLVSRDLALGALVFSSKRRDVYSQDHLQAAKKVADQIAGALANADIHQQHRQAQKDLREAHVDLEARVAARTIELEEARDLALAATQAKSRFLATMSHELRTPLNAVMGYSELLEELAEAKGDLESIPDLKRINSSGKHLLSLVNNILDLAKIESGRSDLYLETFSIAKLVGEVGQICENLALQNGNTLELTCPDDIGEMHADETKVRQAVCNVVGNACKFTENGEISLTVDRHWVEGSERVRVTVKDTGIGMKPEVIEKLFEPFTQADSSTSRVYGGTGLGLTLTRRFCHEMAGEISASSEFGKGSSFVISLPVNVPDPTGVVASEEIRGANSDFGEDWETSGTTSIHSVTRSW